MSRLIEDVGGYLEAQGLGTVGTDIFLATLPDDPDNCIAVYDTGGPAQDAYLTQKDRTFQVIVRNNDYASGNDKLEAVRTALHQKFNLTLVNSGSYYYSIMATSAGGHIGRNGRGLDEFSINFEAIVR